MRCIPFRQWIAGVGQCPCQGEDRRLEEVVAANADVSLPASRSLKKTAGGLIAISLGSTVLAAVVVFAVIRMQAKKKKRKPGSKH